MRDIGSRMIRTTLLFALLTFNAFGRGTDAPTNAPVKVTVPELLAHKQNYKGKRVEVTGYYSSFFEHSALSTDAQHRNSQESLWVDFWAKPGCEDKVKWIPRGEVRIVGTFDFRDKYGSGHLGSWPAGISQVELFEAIKAVPYLNFGFPVRCGRNIGFFDGPSQRVICVDEEGRKRWQKKIGDFSSLLEWNEEAFLMQRGTNVCAIQGASGEERHLFALRNKSARLGFDANTRTLYCLEEDSEDRQFQLLQMPDGKVQWTVSRVETVLFPNESLVLCLTGIRNRSNGGYTFAQMAVEARERATGKPLWKLPLAEDHRVPFLHAVSVGEYVIILDADTRLVCLRARDGKRVQMTEVVRDSRERILDLAVQGQRLVFLTWNPYTLHFCSVPDLREEKKLELASIEIAHFEFYGPYLLTGAVMRRTCFAEDGRLLWEKRQVNCTRPLDGKIYFTSEGPQYEKAQMGLIDLATGREKVLYEESLLEPSAP